MNKFKFKNSIDIDLQNISINGDSINLISISDDYVKDIYREFTEEITTYMIPSPAKEISETYEFISRSNDGMKNQNELVLAITSSQGEFFGCVGLHGRGNCRTPELGVWLRKSAHGNGYGREAVTTLFNWACENLEIDYAIYPVDRSNIPSRKIPESLGGSVFKQAIVNTASGCELDEVIYRINA